MSAPLEVILDSFGLTGPQRDSASERRRSVTVTAGAGSGKTRTLVARYLGLLCEGLAPGQVAAITFTDKAAREMRTRVRAELRRLLLAAQTGEDRARWAGLDAQMDGARIGTIHGLCSEILRAHPAEAGIDPGFTVTGETDIPRLRAEAIEAAMLWSLEQPDLRDLFRLFSISRLENLLGLLLEKRLDVSEQSFDLRAGLEPVAQALRGFLLDRAVQEVLGGLRQSALEGSLAADAGEKLAEQVTRLLALFDQAAQALADGGPQECGPQECAALLERARKNEMALNVGKKGSAAKEDLRRLREIFAEQLEPWLVGKDPVNLGLEAELRALAPAFYRLYTRALHNYQTALRERQSLDFDDLESRAVELLRMPAVALRWQSEISAVLVDEFQDTNHRQREIVETLCGLRTGSLFVVGDARQSIYRFRGADVTVFTGVQQRVVSGGGLAVDLDRTFRAHPALLDCADALLSRVMGDQPDPRRPFHIPYARLHSARASASDGVQSPFVECLVGEGADSDAARAAAARALADRLIAMRGSGELRSWDEAALLFRTSSGFPWYEEAFEAAGVPFVTVAGSGFYDRPEVRDVINLLRALADPWDDQALAGFLRSPAVGMSDPGLYLLRYSGGAYRPLRGALETDQEILAAADREPAARALRLLNTFTPWVDRLPADELLRRLVASTDYRAILAGSRSRLWRNIDKLLRDARASGLVRVRAFLDWVDAIKDSGAREGEAVAEAVGAVRLMTIHKSKGLEFPVVVLADAAHRTNARGALAYLLDGGPHARCWTLAPDRVDGSPLAYRLAKYNDSLQSASETGRLLYVAVTRAMEKVIFSGHVVVSEDGSCRPSGWLGEILDAAGADLAQCLSQRGIPLVHPISERAAMAVCVAESSPAPITSPASGLAAGWPNSDDAPLAAPLIEPAGEGGEAPGERRAPPDADARLVVITGGMVHEALRRWPFARENAALENLVRLHALQGGLREGPLLEDALRGARALIDRFTRHPLFAEINAAAERCHALPVSTGRGKGGEVIDLLFRAGERWTMVDFHAGAFHDARDARAAFAARVPALRARREILRQRIGQPPRTLACFLDVQGMVQVFSLPADE